MTTSSEKVLQLRRSRWRVLALALLLCAAPAAKSAEPDRDPPGRAARVVSVVGDAWLFDQDTREWVQLVRNQTVGEGDRVRTDERARVSLRVGSTTLWLDERADLELSQLDDEHMLLQLDRGDIALRLRSADVAAQTRVHTREGDARPEREGLYRVEQLDRGSKAYVWRGRLRFEWERAQDAPPVWLGDGEQAEFWWPGGPRAERSRLLSDAFGDWVVAESRLDGDLPSTTYVSPEMTGVEDLDRYGRWEPASDYGPLWVPTTVVVGWAPYRYGHWAWSRVWGWTWVDDSPWGFAPFHYGRWVQWRGRWCWAPGPYAHRPVYAPALVGWVGGPPAVSVNITIGHRPPPPRAGWYPLAPREVFVPVYRHTPGYVARLNDPRDLRDPVTVQRPHRYRDVPAAVSTLPAAGWQAPVVRSVRPGRDDGWSRPGSGLPVRGEVQPGQPSGQAVPGRGSGPDGQVTRGWGRPPEPAGAAEGPRRGPPPGPSGLPQPQPQGQPTLPPPVHQPPAMGQPQPQLQPSPAPSVERPAPGGHRPDRNDDGRVEDRRGDGRNEGRGEGRWDRRDERTDERRANGRRPGSEGGPGPQGPQIAPQPTPQFTSPQPQPQPQAQISPRPAPEVQRPRPVEPPPGMRPPEAARPTPPNAQPRGEDRGPVRGRPENAPGRQRSD